MTGDFERLTRLLDLVDRGDTHLLAVRYRLLGDDRGIDPQHPTPRLVLEPGFR